MGQLDKLTYIHDFVRLDHPYLRAIAEQDEAREDIQPTIGPDVGRLLGLLIRMANAKRVLEFGTCLGYSTVWLATAVKATGGHLTSIELRPDLYAETQKNLAAAGLSGYVDLIRGDAKEVAERLAGPFDLILQDSDKALYPEMLERCIALVRPGGLVVADDASFKPMGVPAALSDPVHRYNQIVFADPRLYSTILPIGDGLTISLKL
ncbi:MAG TPA: O-methyltransferase [Bacillota bacterium]